MDHGKSARAPAARLSFASTYYLLAVLLISLVSDGWSGKPSPFLHQLLLLPATLALVVLLWKSLRLPRTPQHSQEPVHDCRVRVYLLLGFELLSIAMLAAENRHFARFGYHLTVMSCLVAGSAGLLAVAVVLTLSPGQSLRAFAAVVMLYGSGLALAIRDFPLNYLRSDMLPVIGWADSRLWHSLNPYTTMHVGTRLYDFPYLPGMLVAYLPAVAAGADLRFATFLYLVTAACLVLAATRPRYRTHVTVLIGAFLLCPFLQYRHDLYLQPHWFTLVAAIVLMQRRRFFWSALVWGLSCALYQLSWVIVPFFILNAWRRNGAREASKAIGGTVAGFLLLAGPFLPFAFRQVASNTVGQWSHLRHALADPINLSFWLTYIVRPDQLRWVQAAALSSLFVYCVLRERCVTLADTLRWMIVALALFISMNVLVDGYFYLTLLLLLLMYVCVAEGLWSEPEPASSPAVVI